MHRIRSNISPCGNFISHAGALAASDPSLHLVATSSLLAIPIRKRLLMTDDLHHPLQKPHNNEQTGHQKFVDGPPAVSGMSAFSAPARLQLHQAIRWHAKLAASRSRSIRPFRTGWSFIHHFVFATAEAGRAYDVSRCLRGVRSSRVRFYAKVSRPTKESLHAQSHIMSADAVSESTPSTDAQSQVPRSNSVTTNDHPPISEFEQDATATVPELFEKQPTGTQLPQQPPSISDGLTKKERIAANRRVIAEDPEWNLAPVKKLVEMCLDMVINHFEKRPIRLEAFPKHHLPTVLARLPTTLPLPLTAPLISRQEYWHRKARDTFAVCDVTSHDPEGKDWKRMFFERWAEDLIESYTPPADRPPETKESDEKTSDPETAFVKDLALASPYIHRLRIGQLVPQGLTLPPPPALPDLLKPKPPATAAQATPQPAPFVAPPQPTFNISPRPIPRAPHIDPGLLIPVPYLTDLTLTYSLRAISTQYRKEYFGITPLDATRLAAAVPQLGSAAGGLRRLAIPRSGLNDEMGRVVIKALLGCPNLKILDLSHNQLSAPSARALAKLITNVAQEANHPAVTHLNLANNRFTTACADSLGHALAHPSSTLSHLDLTLNHLSDEGGCTLLTFLQKNTALTDLNLAANDLRTTSLEALAQLLRTHPNMRSIDVSVNGFVGQDDGGRKLFEGLEGNKTMIRLELRQSGLDDKWAASIEAILDRNRNGSLSALG